LISGREWWRQSEGVWCAGSGDDLVFVGTDAKTKRGRAVLYEGGQSAKRRAAKTRVAGFIVRFT